MTHFDNGDGRPLCGATPDDLDDLTRAPACVTCDPCANVLWDWDA